MADAAEQLRRLYAQRELIRAAGRRADDAVIRGDQGAAREAEKHFTELARVDQAIDRLENENGATP